LNIGLVHIEQCFSCLLVIVYSGFAIIEMGTPTIGCHKKCSRNKSVAFFDGLIVTKLYCFEYEILPIDSNETISG